MQPLQLVNNVCLPDLERSVKRCFGSASGVIIRGPGLPDLERSVKRCFRGTDLLVCKRTNLRLDWLLSERDRRSRIGHFR